MAQITKRLIRSPGRTGPVVVEETKPIHQGSHIAIDVPPVGGEAPVAQAENDPKSRTNPGSQPTGRLPKHPPSAAADTGIPLSFAHHHTETSVTVRSRNKQQPHQRTFMTTAGAEYSVKLPSPLEAQRGRIRKSQRFRVTLPGVYVPWLCGLPGYGGHLGSWNGQGNPSFSF